MTNIFKSNLIAGLSDQVNNNITQDRRRKSVLIVLVNFKRPLDTVACLQSLYKQNFHSWNCIVYENGSEDKSFTTIAEHLRNYFSNRSTEMAHFYDGTNIKVFSRHTNHEGEAVALVEGKVNLGFAGGNNAAIYFAKKIGFSSENFVWFLNNDTEVEQDALNHLVERMNEPGADTIGLCGATLLYFGSNKVVQCYGGARYTKWLGRIYEIGNGELLCSLPNKRIIEASLSYVSGASMFARNKFLERVGLMSEDYFLYFEELDWAVRGKRLGFELGYSPEAKVWHKEGSVLGSGRATRRSPLAEFFGLRSRLLFTRKHYPEAIILIWLVGGIQLLRRLANRQWLNAKALLLALSFRQHPHTK